MPKQSATTGAGGELLSPTGPQELTSKLLHLHFKDDKTKGVCGVGTTGPGRGAGGGAGRQ